MLTVLFGILWIGSMIQLIRYRRQIKDICRQMSFFEKENSNKMITIQFFSKEIRNLADCINELNRRSKKQVLEYEEKDRRLKETLTNLSHDIRTPLTSLSGYIELLTESREEAERIKYQGIINERIKSLQEMLEELFTYTKLKNNVYNLEMQKENVTQIVYRVLFSFYDEMKKQGIEPEMEIDEEAIWIWCNQAALIRVIQNIVKNALEHGCGAIKIKSGVCNQQYFFQCENQIKEGCQIAAEDVFLKFYKGDKARHEESTGLGLAIAKEFTERMGGTIEADIEERNFCIRMMFPVCMKKK